MKEIVLLMLLSLIVTFFVGCANGPRIPLCIYSAERIEFDCVDREGKPFVCDAHDTACDKFVATTPDGYRQILQFMKDHNIK